MDGQLVRLCQQVSELNVVWKDNFIVKANTSNKGRKHHKRTICTCLREPTMAVTCCIINYCQQFVLQNALSKQLLLTTGKSASSIPHKTWNNKTADYKRLIRKSNVLCCADDTVTSVQNVLVRLYWPSWIWMCVLHTTDFQFNIIQCYLLSASSQHQAQCSLCAYKHSRIPYKNFIVP